MIVRTVHSFVAIHTVVIVCLLLGTIRIDNAESGVCITSDLFYLECLEGKHPDDRECGTEWNCLWCVGIVRRWLDRWASDRVAAGFQQIRELPYRDRLIAVAKKFLDEADTMPLVRIQAASVLAFQGIHTIGDHDVFEILTNETRNPPWYALAALGDVRTLDVARREYLEARVDGELTESEKAQLLDIADCLYHIPGQETLVLLRELERREKLSELKRRLQHVLWKRRISREASPK